MELADAYLDFLLFPAVDPDNCRSAGRDEACGRSVLYQLEIYSMNETFFRPIPGDVELIFEGSGKINRAADSKEK